ncbi:Conserved_hypothetical protein [Hexamita inflata]|uniref:AB hydrolase-1 domain-containing protein n=1 Tax=Hexamita inflata TaxID=28002 RepID=A0ABP1LPP1_9EUKA
MRQVITVLIGTLFISILLLKRSRKPKTYKITRFVTKDQHLTSIINEINSSRIPIPSKPNKIQPPKPAYERRSFAYPSDKNDIFYYETLMSEKSVKTPVVIVCFMGGHSKSACIRRVASEFYENGHPVYILLPRGSLDTRIHPQQIKFRSEGYDTEDINSLLGLIPSSKVILTGYSLGGFNVCHFMCSSESNISKVDKLVMAFVEHDPSHTVRMHPRLKKMLGSCLEPYINNNRGYFNAHGFDNQCLDDIIKRQMIEYYDQQVWVKIRKMKNVQEYYDWVKLDERMQELQIPSLFLNTDDDVIGGDYIPLEEMKKNENINAVVFNVGNHLGTVTKDGKDLVSKVIVQWCQ